MAVIDRRNSARFSCKLEAACRPVAMTANWSGKTADISADGVGLVLSRRFEPGTILSISLGGQQDSAYMPLARVRRVTSVGTFWRVGCTWTDELTTDELHGLLPADAVPN